MTRIWIYQSKHKLDSAEKESIAAECTAFISGWAAHNQKLDAHFELLHDRFIVLSVNEAEIHASGCSIDTSVHFIQELDRKYGLSLFDRMQMAYIAGNGDTEVCRFSDIGPLYQSGTITDRTLVFDNTVQDSGSLRNGWKIPFGESMFKQIK